VVVSSRARYYDIANKLVNRLNHTFCTYSKMYNSTLQYASIQNLIEIITSVQDSTLLPSNSKIKAPK